MRVQTFLEEALEDIPYSSLGEWIVTDIEKYSVEKNLFPYQIRAIESAIKALNLYYASGTSDKRALHNACLSTGLVRHSLDVKEYNGKNINAQFARYAEKYPTATHGGEKYIDEIEFFNRMCFWMATASGKTVILIKMIEILHQLQQKGLIPQKDILVLLPNEKIQSQFIAAVREYNISKTRKISVKSLKKYEDVKNSTETELLNELTVFVYRSDLLSDREKSKKVDIVTYDNNGDWYIFMDEAHKGDKDDSLRQSYITVMSRNGFLFNFSATFTDNLDFATTCYNFNLEKFIEAKYGKNIYLSDSNFVFDKNGDELSEADKQLQVLKSMIVFTLVKKAKKVGYYHNPLMVTLVNEVNTENSDIDMFFAELAKIAAGKVNKDLLNRAKTELYDEFFRKPQFKFGTEQLYLDNGEIKTAIDKIDVSDILYNAFNSPRHGQIEILEGEKGKEFALKLATAEKPFALFRIGDAAKYIKEKLTVDYRLIDSYEDKRYFDNLNNNESSINILIGSRMFYEGWDSNRPNVMNFINIGTGDAKKFVLQSLGRGVRIQPDPNDPKNRQRLKANNSNKEQLLETLFVFATSRAAVNTILETMDTQRIDEITLSLNTNARHFDLLIPIYAEKDRTKTTSKFNISEEAYKKLKLYIDSMSDELLLLTTDIQLEDIMKLRDAMIDPSVLFRFNESRNYTDIKSLLDKVATHLSINDRYVSGFTELNDDIIIHFNHIKIAKAQWEAHGKQITEFINDTSDGSGETEAELYELFTNKKIDRAELIKRLNNIDPRTEDTVGELQLFKLANHFYSPLIVAKHEKLEYIKHIINVKSEIEYIINLIKYVNDRKSFSHEWMFSKIDQTIDGRDIALPYYDPNDNAFHPFYPDFIFWQKNGDDYKITFVDPKGTKHTDYEYKVDYFKSLFMQDGEPKVFKHGSYNITLALKLITDDKSLVPKEYSDFWYDNNDFSWLD